MRYDGPSVWFVLLLIALILSICATTVGSIAFTRTNTANNPNNIFIGSTSLTDFAATQTVKTRNILGSSLAPAAITTAGTLFNGDLNANSLSFTDQGLTLYSNTSALYFLLEGDENKHFLSSNDSLTLSGVVTSVGTVTSIPDGNITDAMLANAAVANLSGSSGATTVTGTLEVTGTLAVTGTSTFTGESTFDGITCNSINMPSPFAGSGDLVTGSDVITGISTMSAADIIILTPLRPVATAGAGTLVVDSIQAGVGFTVKSVDATGAVVVADGYSYYYLVIEK